MRRALLRETSDHPRTSDQDEDQSGSMLPAPPPAPTTQASSHVHLHVNAPPSPPFGFTNAQSSPSRPNVTWNYARPGHASSSNDPPPPPPLPSEEVRSRGLGGENSRNVCEVGVQTDGATGLTDQQLCEIEIITSSARTPGVLHIFPDCHALRSVSSTNRRTFCRYCLMTLRQRGR